MWLYFMAEKHKLPFWTFGTQFSLSFATWTKMQRRFLALIWQKECRLPVDSNWRKKCRRLWLTISEVRVIEKRRMRSCFRIIQQSIFLSAIFLSTGIKMLALIQRHLISLLHYRSGPAVAASVEMRAGLIANLQSVLHQVCKRWTPPSKCIFLCFNLCLVYTWNFVLLCSCL